jgi:hypothetical protein
MRECANVSAIIAVFFIAISRILLQSAPDAAVRSPALERWEQALGARFGHPYEDHLIPLMVAAGAAGEDRGVRDYSDHVFGVPVSGYRFG